MAKLTAQELMEKLDQLSADIATLRRFVHGDVTETVSLGNVDTPVLRHFMALIDARESSAAQAVITAGENQISIMFDNGQAQINLTAAEVEQMLNQALVAANNARYHANSIHDMTAEATTVAYGEPATASYDNEAQRMFYEIPQGAPGATGPAGPPGTAPYIDVIDCGGAYATQLTTIDAGQACSFMVEDDDEEGGDDSGGDSGGGGEGSGDNDGDTE